MMMGGGVGGINICGTNGEGKWERRGFGGGGRGDDDYEDRE